jgi:PAS domain S-box-containing protein
VLGGRGESDALYRDLYENAPNPYLIVGTDGRILRVNRRVCDMLGYSAEELLGATVHSFMADTPAGKTRGLEVSRMHLAGESVVGWELELRRRDGQPLWIKFWMEPSRGADGSIGPGRSFFVDITDHVLADLRTRLLQQALYLREEIQASHDFEQIIGRSPALLDVLGSVKRVAPTDASVLVTGETGTGKELIARAIHFHSRRRDKPLIKVNCAALPSSLVETEFFGHERGAFTGAVNRRLGRFELADGGTLFLDEVGELPREAQAKLLRVLQEGEFDRVGGTAPVRVDVRVIAATNRDVLGMVREKAFREDLYFRLNVFPIHMPPLRDRPDDIPLLVGYLVSKFGQRIGKHLGGVAEPTMQRLQEYSWPGNVRELENVLERAVILATGPILEIPTPLPPVPAAAATLAPPERGQGGEKLPQQKPDHAEGVSAESVQPAPGRPLPTLAAVERDYILAVLRQTNWIITGPRGAAQVLGLPPSTLANRMKKLGIKRAAPDTR